MSYLQQVSSGTEEETRFEVIDEKKKRRMISNRESARRSRMKKQQRMEDLIRECDQLQRANSEIIGKIEEMTRRLSPVVSESKVLRAQVTELTERLNYLNTIISNLESANGNKASVTPNNGGVMQTDPNFWHSIFDESQDIEGFLMDIPDPLLKPWQSSCSSQPIMASASMFQF